MASASRELTGTSFQDSVPPLRPEGSEMGSEDPDGLDTRRVEYARQLWRSLDDVLRDRDRQIEKHIRMLAGQQWVVWSRVLGRWIDVRDYMSDEERRWRYLPVINRVMHWFMLLHARMTENPPVITFQPASGDKIDAELAEIMDVVWKHLWSESNMIEVVDHIFAWLIPGGSSYAKSRIDPLRGDPIRFEGQAKLQLLGPDGQPSINAEGEAIERLMDGVPFDREGQPLARLTEGGLERDGEPHIEYEGALVVDALSPLEVRGEWGPKPWDQKRIHMHRSLITPEEAFDTLGIEVEPTVFGQQAQEAGTMRRMLFGAGFFGAGAGVTTPFGGGDQTDDAEYVEVIEIWQAPRRFPGMMRTEEKPGGRLLVAVGDKVARDGQRYAAFEYTSPIREFRFVNLPGRPSGTSPEEMMVGPQSTYNRVVSQILQHVTLAANPIRLVDKASGISENQVTNEPGLELRVTRKKDSPPPIEYVNPGQLSQDVWRTQQHLRQEMDDIGNVTGSEGRPPTRDSSGELVKELRFNSDRFVGPTLRRATITLGRMAEDWKVMLPIIWDEEKVIRVAGDDMVVTTVTVLPHLFEKGRVNVVPEIESMLPEGRGERQSRILNMYQLGLFGEPGSAGAVRRYFELANFPHMSRAVRPGGTEVLTAKANVGKLLRGAAVTDIAVFPWYELAIHIEVLEEFMKSPEYLKQDVPVMQQMVDYRSLLYEAQAMRFQQQQQMQALAAEEMGEGAVQAQAATQEEAKRRGIAPEPEEAEAVPA